MKNELLRIGPFTIYGYGLMIAIGILAAYFTGEYRAKKRKLPYEHVFLSGGMVCSGRIPGRQDPVLDYRMEKYPGKSGVPECYSDRWLCGIWWNCWWNFHGVCILQGEKTGFSEVF